MKHHEPTKISAIQSLCTELYPNEGVTIQGKGADLKDLSCLKLGDNVTPSFTWGDVETRLTELQAEWTNEEYARNRRPEYPSTGDQLDMMYKDTKNSTTTHAAAVEAVKTKWPKDNSGPV